MTDSDTQFVRPLREIMVIAALARFSASRAMLRKSSDPSEKSTPAALANLAHASLVAFTRISTVYKFSQRRPPVSARLDITAV